jgi:hypothetical protein
MARIEFSIPYNQQWRARCQNKSTGQWRYLMKSTLVVIIGKQRFGEFIEANPEGFSLTQLLKIEELDGEAPSVSSLEGFQKDFNLKSLSPQSRISICEMRGDLFILIEESEMFEAFWTYAATVKYLIMHPDTCWNDICGDDVFDVRDDVCNEIRILAQSI